MNDVRKESSAMGTGNVVGFQAPGTEIVSRKEKSYLPYIDPEMLEQIIADAALHGRNIKEVVRKHGSLWVMFDDDTEKQIMSFRDRPTAWDKQRSYRKRRKLEKQRGRQTKKKATAHRQLVKKLTSAKPKRPKSLKRESVDRKIVLENIKDVFKKALLKEGGVLSYVFETPENVDSTEWDQFLKGVAKETVLSDPKLKKIVSGMQTAETRILKKSSSIVKNELQKAGFQIQNMKMGLSDEDKKVRVDFDVLSRQDKDSFHFAIKIENGKALIHIPEETRMQLNSINSPSTKLLRSTLISTQEIELDQLDSLAKNTGKRDQYLSGLSDQMDKVIGNMNPLELAMIKRLIKMKYKNVA